MRPQISDNGARPNVRIHIERLVLDGFDFAGGGNKVVQAAIQNELVRLLSEGHLNLSGGATAKIAAPSMQLRFQNDAHELGREIGRTVFGSVCEFNAMPAQSALPNGSGARVLSQ